jgi:hypothetical protein
MGAVRTVPESRPAPTLFSRRGTAQAVQIREVAASLAIEPWRAYTI